MLTPDLPSTIPCAIDGKDILLRYPTPKDLNYIYSSFLKSHRWDIPTKRLDNPNYYRVYHSLLEEVLATDYTVLVAANPHNEQDIFGYLIGSRFHLFFIKVRQPIAGLKLATSLFQAYKDLFSINYPLIITNISHQGRIFLQTLNHNFIYIPSISSISPGATKAPRANGGKHGKQISEQTD